MNGMKWRLLAVPALQFVGVPAVVIGLAGAQLLTLMALAAMSWLVLRGATPERKRLFLFAALLGTLGEELCVAAPWFPDGRGLWSYRFPPLLGLALPLPLWLPLVWGNLFTLFADLADRLGGVMRRLGEPGRYLLALLIIAYAGFIYHYVAVSLLVLFTPFFAGFLLYWNTAADLTVFLIAGILGMLGELLAMKAGLWIYTMPVIPGAWAARFGLPGFPLSLVMAWGLCAVILTRLARRQGRAPA